MEKLRMFIWRLFWSPEKQAEKKQHWITKQIEHLIRGASGGGYLPPTFWEKVKITLLLLFLIGMFALLYVAIIVAATTQVK